MKKSLLLGSAAALVAVTGAQAADLPVVEPVDYVKVCDAFGAGFHYIPGTETCLKFSGRVRAEIGVGDDDDDDDKDDQSFLNSNFELVVNASSMTEVGMVVGQFAISGSNEGAVELGDAWISIGENILVGRETSRFDFGGGYGIYDGYYVDEGINQFTFIMPFGNGFSATIGLEDGRDRVALPADVDTGAGFSWSQAFSTSHVGGMEIPDVVASLRLSQAWGSAQVSGALHQLRPIADDTPNTQVTDDQFGWAVQAGVEVNVSSATKVKVVAAYADGALAYVGGSSFIEVGVQDTNPPAAGSYFGEILETLSGWYVLGAVSHDFTDQLNLSATVAYHEFEEQADILYLGATAEYEVVENLVVSVAGNYVSTDYSGAAVDALGDVVDTTDTDTWEAKLRVQRNF